MMKKKVKKIPKYDVGSSGVTADYLNKISGGAPTVNSSFVQQNMSTTGLSKDASAASGGSGFGGGWGAFGAAATAGGKMLMNAFGVEDNSQAGVTLNTSMQGAEIGGAIMPGWGHLIGGIAGGAIGAFKKGSVDVNTGEITSGGIFGRSGHSLRSESNRIKNSIRAKTMTQGVQADYYNNPNVQVQPILAAEGGIMRKPVDALVSKGELIYNPITKKLSKVPGSKGKANNNDDVYAELQEGDMVISNSPTMLMSNGKTPALNLEGLVDNDKNMKAKEAIIKKVVNWLEANRTKPQEYAMYDEGTGEDGAQESPKKKRRNSIWNRLQDKWNASAIEKWMNNYYENIDKYEDHAIIDGRLFIKHDGKWYDSHDGHLGREIRGNILPESGKGYMVRPYNNVPFNQGVFTDIDATKIKRYKPVEQPSFVPENVSVTTHPEIDPVYSRHQRYNYAITEDQPTANTTASKASHITAASKKGTVSKPSSGKKKTAAQTVSRVAPSLEDAVVRRPQRVYDNEEPAKIATTPANNTKIYGRDGSVRYDYNTPETRVTTETSDTGDTAKKSWGSNWQDNLYRMAVLSQPLWDRAKAEPVNYESPVYKYMPTSIDVSGQLRDVDQSYALARYNFANLYPNTGAGMAAGLQAASNRAKQLADIRQYQTNAQNELIGKNVGIYNNWANDHARIMNSVYDKTAANRAAARNINRQNRAAALANYGQMLRDDKANKVERMKFAALTPAIKSTYEDGSAMDIYNLYHELFG